ncbi:hypothetical protein BIY37_03425 [Candidatus Brocadia sapporoensis]|uniref:HTH cro/C1-type domain-containing protein n=1 Tax=Candidatus Brocadia sapporoensis TaxID=392547 RepID=A0A1V6M1Z0_9BACT|nr:hypothetical protein BIY37_03425 [Candidatus Brocadia sapporoensis]
MRKNLSQKKFAEKIGVPIATYQRYEYGETLPPEPVLKRVAEVCNTTVDEILGRDSFETLRRFIAKEQEAHAATKEADKAYWEKIGKSIAKWGIPVPEEINPKELLKIITIYARHGINMVEIIKGQISPEKQGGIIQYEGQERRKYWPYTQEEQLYHDKLQAILKGKNKKNALAIKQNIDAFYETRDVEIPLEKKKAEGS